MKQGCAPNGQPGRKGDIIQETGSLFSGERLLLVENDRGGGWGSNEKKFSKGAKAQIKNCRVLGSPSFGKKVEHKTRGGKGSKGRHR